MACDVRCTHCSQQLQVLEEHVGKQVRCPKCYQVFTAGRPAAPPEAAQAADSPAPVPDAAPAPPAAAGGPAPAPRFCPHCGAALTSGASFCAACGRPPFQAPEGAGTAAAPSMPSYIPAPYSPTAQTSGLAVASLIFGLLNFAVCITFIPGIVCGHMAHARIRDSGGTLGGSGLATWGLALNYIAAAFMTFVVLMAIAGG
jgi:DNA-directed RNA polymerase subunit RPC12/RpoP